MLLSKNMLLYLSGVFLLWCSAADWLAAMTPMDTLILRWTGIIPLTCLTLLTSRHIPEIMAVRRPYLIILAGGTLFLLCQGALIAVCLRLGRAYDPAVFYEPWGFAWRVYLMIAPVTLFILLFQTWCYSGRRIHSPAISLVCYASLALELATLIGEYVSPDIRYPYPCMGRSGEFAGARFLCLVSVFFVSACWNYEERKSVPIISTARRRRQNALALMLIVLLVVFSATYLRM